VIVTVTSLVTAPGANETVALPSALVTVPPLAMVTFGGDGPLPGFAAGSEFGSEASGGAVVAPSDWVADASLEIVALPLPDDVPAAGADPVMPCVLGSLLVVPLAPPLEMSELPLAVTVPPATSLAVDVELRSFGLPVAPDTFESLGAAIALSTVPAPSAPIVAVTWSCDTSGDVSELVLLWELASVENQPMPVEFAAAAADACGSVEPPAGVAGVVSAAAGVDGAVGAEGAAGGV
jgi:hypothetical protein